MLKVIGNGRLVEDPTQTTKMVKYRLASDRYKNGDKDTVFIDVIAVGAAGDFAMRNFRKGSSVMVCGDLENRPYTNRNGVKVDSWQIFATDQSFDGQGERSTGSRSPRSGGGERSRRALGADEISIE